MKNKILEVLDKYPPIGILRISKKLTSDGYHRMAKCFEEIKPPYKTFIIDDCGESGFDIVSIFGKIDMTDEMTEILKEEFKL